jgi:hypothetical protein
MKGAKCLKKNWPAGVLGLLLVYSFLDRDFFNILWAGSTALFLGLNFKKD